MKMQKVLALLLTLVLSISLIACGNASSSQPAPSAPGSESAPASLVPQETPKEKIILGTSADYPPYEFHKIIDGKDQIVGFDISLAQLIAEKLGKELEIRDIPFDSCLIELNTDKVDFVIAGMSPDADRDAFFTDIYYKTTQCVLVRKGEAAAYKDVASLAGKTIGAQLGSAQEKAAKQEMPQSNLVSLQKVPDLLMDLTAGKSEAVVMEQLVAKSYLASNDNMEIAFDLEYMTAGCAVAVKTGNQELLDQINVIVNEALADGTLDRFIDEAAKLAADQMS